MFTAHPLASVMLLQACTSLCNNINTANKKVVHVDLQTEPRNNGAIKKEAITISYNLYLDLRILARLGLYFLKSSLSIIAVSIVLLLLL